MSEGDYVRMDNVRTPCVIFVNNQTAGNYFNATCSQNHDVGSQHVTINMSLSRVGRQKAVLICGKSVVNPR